MNRIKSWATILDVNEQRYRSLFEQNPNAVFSLTKDGLIASGNDTFERLSGYMKDEFNMMNLNILSVADEQDNIENRFRKVLDGHPQSFETRWKRKSGEELILQMTALPIHVNDEIEGAFVVAEDITYQKYAEEKIKNQLDEKGSLLEEIHDRVKNNLALMSSILQLQDQYLDDEVSRKNFESAISRIRSIALVHERLYQTDNFASIRMDEFIRDLIASYRNTLQKRWGSFDIICNMEPVQLSIRQAVPCGLLLNELIMNSIKFAFEHRDSGKLEIYLSEKDNIIHLKVKDDGDGLPDDFDIDKQTTLGMTLIKTLSSQLGTQPEINGNGGTEISISFQNSMKFSTSS